MDMIKRRDEQKAYVVDEAVLEEHCACQRRLQEYNSADWGDFDLLRRLAKDLLGKCENALIKPPFMCDYGTHIFAGDNLFINCNCTILDVAPVTIGHDCRLAPNVGIYTAGHPIHPSTRATGYEYGKEVTIGDYTWIGGSSVICPGVHIGECCVIGAGSVVTHDIPAWSIAVGNPCRVVRRITEEDRRNLLHGEPIDEEAWQDILGIFPF